MNNVVGETEWFAGRPYSDGDSYQILRRHTTSGNHSNSTATAATSNTVAVMDIDSAGNTVFAGSVTGGAGTFTGTLTLGTTTGSNINMLRTSANYINATNAAGYLVFRTGGTDTALTLDASQNATFAGTLTIPSYIYHTGDPSTDTYFGFNGNDNFTVVTAGGNGLVIDSNRNATFTGNLTTGNGNIECNDIDVSGTITGDGSSVDSLNAGNIATGTLAVARGGTGLTSISTLLNSNVTSVSGNAGSVTNGVYTNTTQTISGGKTFSGNTTFSGAISQSNTTQSTNKSSGAYKTNGGVGIAKTLNVGEDVVAYASSDKRYKDNLQAITNPIDKVKSLTGYTFTWNDKHEQFNGNDDIGVVAQEVEKVFPEIVDTRDNGYKAVKYEKMVALLIEAIKDQQKQIDELKEKCSGCSK